MKEALNLVEFIACPLPPIKRGDPNFENFKRGGDLTKTFVNIFFGENQKEGEIFKMEGGTQLFKLNIGIKRAKMGTVRDKLA